MIQLDPITRAEHDAETTTEARAAVVLAALSGEVSATVRDENGATRAAGVMLDPWATIVGHTLAIGQVSGFTVTEGGTPDGWTLRFSAGDRWVEGSFGFSNVDFTWSLPTFETGQVGAIGTVTLVTQGIITAANDLSLSWDVQVEYVPPAWFGDVPDMTYTQIADTTLDTIMEPDPARTTNGGASAWAGASLKHQGSEIFFSNGGHGDGSSNAVYSLKLSSDQPKWVMRRGPTPADQLVTHAPYYLDGRPSSRHTYWQIQFHQQRNELMFVGASSVWGPNGGYVFPHVDSFRLSTNDYYVPTPYPDMPVAVSFGAPVAQDTEGNVYTQNRFGGTVYKWATNEGDYGTWHDLGVHGGGGTHPIDQPMVYDPVRNRLVRFTSTILVVDLNGSTPVSASVTATGDTTPLASVGTAVYCDFYDAYLLIQFGSALGGDPLTIYRCDPDTWNITVLPVQGVGPTLFTSGSGYLYGRFMYVPELQSLVIMPRHSQNLVIVKLAQYVPEQPVGRDYTASWSMRSSVTSSVSPAWNINAVAAPTAVSNNIAPFWVIEGEPIEVPDGTTYLRWATPIPFPLTIRRGQSYYIGQHVAGGKPPYTFTATNLATGLTMSPDGYISVASTAPLGQKYPSPTELSHDTRSVSNDVVITVTDAS